MAHLHSRLGTWTLEHVHAWADRELTIRRPSVELVDPSRPVATIGSCFAEELAKSMREAGTPGAMHPGGLYYSTASIRQELELLAGGWAARDEEPLWEVGGGFLDPFRSGEDPHPSREALLAARARQEERAREMFSTASVVVVTLGLIETWRSPVTGNAYRQIPHPAVFEDLQAQFHRLTVTEMLADLERIRDVVCGQWGAQLVLTTSPVPLHTTFTDLDVRVANCESKSRVRAAVSEFVEAHPEVHYFHAYEIVTTAERASDFFIEDGRHVRRVGVNYIVSQFLKYFADASLQMPEVDTSWMTPITKTEPTPARLQPQPAVPAVQPLSERRAG